MMHLDARAPRGEQPYGSMAYAWGNNTTLIASMTDRERGDQRNDRPA
jgi:hypothetical protein